MSYLRLFLTMIFLIVLFGIFSFSQSLPVPGNLSVKAGEFGGAFLTWDTVSGSMGYIVYKSIDGSSFASIAAVPRSMFNDWWIIPDHLYRYYVTAFRKVGMVVEEGTPSDTVTFAFGLHHKPLPGQGIIGGKIMDEKNGLPLKGAVVSIFQPGKLWAEKTHTDTGGIYWAAIDTGRYILRADKFDYFGEWFDNVLHLDSVTVVSVHEDSFAIANFALRHLPVPEVVTVSGIVIDSLNSQPLAQTFVAFLRPHRWLRELQVVTGIFGGLPTECVDVAGLGRLFGVVWMGKTDANGIFNAHLIKGLKYIALAFKPGYVPEFYDNKYIPFTADRLRFTSDTSGIDFKLLSNPIAINTLNGSVVDSSGTGIPSNVILYRKTVLGRIPVRFTMTDSLGNFEFNKLVNGIFYIKAYPVDAYSPAWYSSLDCGVRNWRFADTINVSGNVTGIEVCVKPVPRLGFARIAGNVRGPRGNLMAETIEQAVTVYAVSTATNQIVGYDISEDDGSYSIENLPAGTYSIVIDKEGFTGASEPLITVDETNNYEVADATIFVVSDPTSVDEKVQSVPAVFKLYQNYPNPFNPTTQIRFDLPKSSSVVLKVFNLIGQEVEVLVNKDLAAGTHTVRWNAQIAGTGIYFFKIVATPPDGSGARFSEVRKMIYLK
ncbi:MAG: carboxypeptidase regulatory-like domain-containing protein [Ignavibacteriales bacterium]|nr:carboxypeptidase regulatory-like domain-containing protein [Ignavibacteriales bacterium]